jgi:hypothetical protein
MKFYPQPPAVITDDAINPRVDGPTLIALMQSGATAEYAAASVGIAPGDELGDDHLVGIALRGRNAVPAMKALLAEVRDERAKLAVVNPADFDTQTDFVKALDEVCVHADSGAWLVGLKASVGATTWPALKSKFEKSEAPATLEP